MSKSDDKRRRELLQEAKRSGVEVPRGTPTDEIDRQLQDRFRENAEAVLGCSVDELWFNKRGGAR